MYGTLAFYLLLPGNAAFEHPMSAFIKVDVMMSGEFDFDDNFVFDGSENMLAQAVFFVFFITMTLVLTNLLIGMTVSKTEELLKQANMIKLQKMVAQILCLEDMLSKSRQLRRLLPKPARRWLDRKTRLFAHFDALKEGTVCMSMSDVESPSFTLFTLFQKRRAVPGCPSISARRATRAARCA